MITQNRAEHFPRWSLIGWCLFDFANSIPAVIGGVYFAKWFTIDINAGSITYNLLFFISTLLVILFGRWVGKKIDKDGYKYWIKLSSGITLIALLLLCMSSKILPSSFIVPFSFLFFSIFLFGYQISRICHNTYLRVVIPEPKQSKISGLGTAANWAGSIVGILLSIPAITLYPGIIGRELTFLIATIGYGILTPVALLLMFSSKEPHIFGLSPNETKHKNLTWQYMLGSVGSLLLVYFLLFDVMATVQRNLPPYLTAVLAMKDDTQAIGFLIILCSAMIGGLSAAKIVMFTNAKIWLRIGSSTLAIAIVLVTLRNDLALWVGFVLAGLSYGVLESAIRVNYMSTFSPQSAGENFGVLAVVERASGIIGPLIWIIPFMVIENEAQSYILSMLLMAGTTVLALLLLYRKKTNRTSMPNF